MRTFTFICLIILTSLSVNAQVFIIDAPSSVAGSYEFSETVDYGANVLDDIWCGDLILGEDDTDPLSDGCTPLVNGAEISGNIAVIDRGSCNFSLKSYHAQEAGAIALIIVNNAPGDGLVGMLGGDSAAAVVIPTIFITFEDGDQIKTAMAAGTVSACLGNIVFDNNISISSTSVSVPFNGTIPSNQITNTTVYSGFAPAANVSNDGLLDAANVTTQAIINFTPSGGAASEVYNESATTSSIPIDTGNIEVLPLFDFTASGEGVYDVAYTVSADAMDELDSDNSAAVSFSVTSNVFSKGSWDYDNNRPNRNTAFTIAGGGPIEMISAFQVPNGIGTSIDSVTFYCSTQNDNLDGIIVKANLYKWDDMNDDSLFNNDELTLVGINNITFENTTTTEAWVTLPILDAVNLEQGYDITEDNAYFLVGTRYEGADFVFFGFYDDYDHTVIDDLAAFPTAAEFPYFQVSTFPGQVPDIESGGLFTDFFGTTSTAMWVTGEPTSTKEVLTDIDATLNLYPNPVSDLLVADVVLGELSSNMVYKITDTNGRLIFTTQVENVTTDKAEFNVSQLPAGQYYMTIQTDKGIRTQTFSVNR